MFIMMMKERKVEALTVEEINVTDRDVDQFDW